VITLREKSIELRQDLEAARILLSLRYGNIENSEMPIPILQDFMNCAAPLLTDLVAKHFRDLNEVSKLDSLQRKTMEYQVRKAHFDEMYDVVKEMKQFATDVCYPIEPPEDFKKYWKAAEEGLNECYGRIMELSGPGFI
jgi:hypothetical protein